MEPACKRPKVASQGPVATFGEALLRFQALEPLEASRPQRCLRSVGGDELNVAVALSRLQVPCRWISVLPSGPLGDLVRACQVPGHLDLETLEVKGDLGIFTVLQEQQTVHYQRRSEPKTATDE